MSGGMETRHGRTGVLALGALLVGLAAVSPAAQASVANPAAPPSARSGEPSLRIARMRDGATGTSADKAPVRGSSAQIQGGSSADRYGGTSADRTGMAGNHDPRLEASHKKKAYGADNAAKAEARKEKKQEDDQDQDRQRDQEQEDRN